MLINLDRRRMAGDGRLLKNLKAKVRVQKSKVKKGNPGLGTPNDPRLRTSSNPDPELQTPAPGFQSPAAGPLRVLQVIPSVGPLRGGPSEAIRTLTRGLARAGMEVHVATTDDNGPGRLSVPLGTPVREGRAWYRYFPRQLRPYTVSWPLSRWLARHVGDYDLVHIHAVFSFAPTMAAVWARRAEVPYIVRPLGVLNQWGMRQHRPWVKRVSFRCLERPLLGGAAALHYTSEQERQEVARLKIECPTVVIPNPVEAPLTPREQMAGRFRTAYPQLKGRTVLVFLSRLDAKKGLELLLLAFAGARARYPALALVVAGEGDPSYVSSLRRLASRLGIGDATIWTGFVRGAQKWEVLAGADVFVLPSYSENFAVAAAEAMTVGVPVLVSDRVGIHGAIVDAKAGLVVPCVEAAWTQAILEMVTNVSERHQMGRRAGCLAKERFSLEVVTKQLVYFYEELVATARLRHHPYLQ
jgi:glycosyltransferase involved in cell wall biosynthesis